MRTEPSLVGAPDKTPVREIGTKDNRFKRNNHGGVAWTAADRTDNLQHQPQDGADRAVVYTATNRKALPREPEDARLTGGTRSLMRRVMGLNVTTTALAAARKAGPKTVAGKSQAQVA